MIKKLTRHVLNVLGYEIRTQSSTLLAPARQVDDAINRIKHATMLPRERLTSLYDQVVYCQRAGIPGAFVECGVWKGGAVGLMALAVQNSGGIDRHIHLFDSFQDICEPDPRVDGPLAVSEASRWLVATMGRLVPMTGFYDGVGGPGSLDGNRELLEGAIGYSGSLLHYHVGWFQDTLPRDRNDVGSIALLRLDGDWYASTKICLEYLYDSVVAGGFVIIDDYGVYEGCRRATDEFFSERGAKVFPNRVDGGCVYVIKP